VVQDVAEAFFKGQPKPETVAEFYQSLAASITMWQRVEFGVVEIALVAVKPELPGAFLAADHAPQHTRSQINMTDAALQFWFECYRPRSEDLQKEWDDRLLKRLNKCLHRRNALVHFSAFCEPGEKIEHEKMYLQPALSDTRHLSPEKRRLTVVNIKTFGETFLTLSRDLLRFKAKMVKFEE
jgi:hypothetical protein